ncbi:hypothetical protein [Brevundimonas goettingensis]|uniref:Uncharacterized protein n=1 Tax=Brevundimonas goettingensis TaxID=2774190 RepID=A0A975GXX3_9CAUL|nr:hypothetical protein [Brevundimonas goettingensis]QTC91000.1 hypothetical protein IFJ75_17545 [Brevundimonas goettingensis]
MPPTQLFFLISVVVILPIAWLKGGHAERTVAVVLLVNYLIAPFLQPARVGELMFGLAVADAVLLGVLGWLTLKFDRWWLLLATAAQGLVVMAYLAVMTRPEVTARENIVAQWVFGLFTLYALLGGVLERWLAGERPTARPLLRHSARPQP